MALVRAFGEPEHDPPHLDDPFDWTVDHVIYALCSPNSAVLSWGGGVYLDNPEQFAQVLRDEQIDGEALLTSVDLNVLQYELGITARGARVKINNLIEKLKDQSSKCQEILERKFAREHRLPSSTPTRQTHTPSMTSPQFSDRNPQNFLPGLGYGQPVMRLGQTPHSPKSLVSATATAPTLDASSKPCQVETGSGVGEGITSPADLSNQPQETSFTDEKGRERRRLAPTFVTETSLNSSAPTSSKTANGVSTKAADDGSMREPRMLEVNNLETCLNQVSNQTSRLSPVFEELPNDAEGQIVDSVSTFDDTSNHPPSKIDHRRRVKPSLVQANTTKDQFQGSSAAGIASPNSDAAKASKLANVSEPSENDKMSKKRVVRPIYYGPSAFLVDEIFYGGMALGEASLDKTQPLTTEEQEISFNSAGKVIEAQRSYVNSRMNYLLRTAADNCIVKDEPREIGIIPYSERLGQRHRPLSMTVFSRHGNMISKARVNRLDWIAAFPTKASNAFHVSDPSMVVSYHEGNFDALEKWNYIDGDRVLPLYGESDSEDDYDSQTYREMEAEKLGKKAPGGLSRTPKLTPEEIAAAIDNAIRQFSEEWQTKKRPKFERKAWRIWTKARRDHVTEIQIEGIMVRLDTLEERIGNLRIEIGKEEWFNINQVMKQSKSLQPSVFEREEDQWRLAILRSRSAPPKLPPAPKSGVYCTTQARHDDKDLDIVAESADDEETEDDFDDFIVDDEPDHRENNLNPDMGDVTMGDDEDLGLSDTLIESPSPVASHPKTPASTSVHATQNHAANIIDLTQLSDSEDAPPKKPSPKRIVTPPILDPEEDSDVWFERNRSIKAEFKHPPKSQEIPVVAVDDDSDQNTLTQAPLPPSVKLPPLSDIEGIMKLDLMKLVEKQDRKRLLIFIVANTEEHKRNGVMNHILHLEADSCLSQVRTGLKGLRAGRLSIAGTDQETSDAILQIIAWYIQWTVPIKLGPRGILTDHIKIALKTTKGNDEGFSTFYEFLPECLRYCSLPTSAASVRTQRSVSILSVTKKKTKKRKRKGAEASDQVSVESTPSKRQKGKERTPNKPNEENPRDEDQSDSSVLSDLPESAVLESQETLQKRDAALQRMREDTQRVRIRSEREERRRELMPRLEALAAKQTEDSKVILNPGRLDDRDLIYLNPEFGRGAHLKPHQKDGLKFMWREITADNNDLQGCLLAQTMGLGKTIQVIALLVAISDAANSQEENIRSQVRNFSGIQRC